MTLTLQQRCNSYKVKFPDYPSPFIGKDGRIIALWFIGNNYKSGSGYYGAYPPSYLERIKSMFPVSSIA